MNGLRKGEGDEIFNTSADRDSPIIIEPSQQRVGGPSPRSFLMIGASFRAPLVISR